MNTQRSIYLFRHGQTEWNRLGKFQGHSDIPLNDEGRRQAKALIHPLKTIGIEALFSSDLIRAIETATTVGNALGINTQLHPGLREANLGQAEGLTKGEIVDRFGEDLILRWRNPERKDFDLGYPGGETRLQILDRVEKTLLDILNITSAKKIGIATHGGVMARFLQMRVLEPGAPFSLVGNGVIYGILIMPKQNGNQNNWTLLNHLPWRT